MWIKHCRRASEFFLGCVSFVLVSGIVAITPPSFGAAAATPVERSALRSATEIDYAPFSFVDEHGGADGFSVELLRAALDAMGRDVTFRTGPWAEVRGLLERGEIDVLPLVGRTPEREGLFDFTVPYMSLHGAIVVRDNETDIMDMEDLRGRTVAVMKGDNAEEFLRRKERGITIHTTPTFEAALKELSEGRHDAVVIQRLVGLRLIRKAGLTDLRVIDRPIEEFKQDFSFAVHEGDRQTLALLNEGLAIVMADGTYRHLHAKWFAAMQLPSERPIIVGGDRNYPPFEFIDDNGKPAGYNVDLTRAIAREMGLDVEIRLGRWQERIQALEDGRIDVLQGMFYSTARDLVFDFSQPHTISHYVAVVRKGEGEAPSSVAELKGKKIVVQEGDILNDFAVENGLDKELVAVVDQEEALRRLAAGEYDCALVSLVAALYLTEKHDWPHLVAGKKPLLAAEYGYAASTGGKALLAKFSEGLKALEESGEYRRIHDKWLGVYRTEPTTFFDALRYFAVVFVPLVLVLLLAFVWSWSLRRKVAQRTAELQESLERFKYVFEAANVGKTIISPSGVMKVNEAFAGFLGYSPGELQGKKWQKLTPAEEIEANGRIIESLLAGEKDGARFEKRYIHKNGTPVWADVSIVMRRDSDGTPLYFVTTVIDIDEKKKTAEALYRNEEYLRVMIACSPVALYSVDLEGKVVSWNRSSERVFGWSAAEVIGTPLPIIPVEKGEEFDALRRIISTGESVLGRELERLRKDGSRITISLSIAPLKDDRGEIVGILAVAEDITERKRALARIEHLNQVLRAIRDINQLIVRERDRQTLIREGARLLAGSRGYQAALLILTDDHDMPFTWAMEAPVAITEELSRMLDGGVLPSCCAHAREAGGVFVVDDRASVCFDCSIAKSCAERQSICAPLLHEGELFGYLAAAAEQELVVDVEEQELFSELAGDFAYALSVMRLEEARREGAAALHESESRFRLFAELAPVGIVIADEQENTLYANPRFIELLGYTLEDVPSLQQWWERAYLDEAFRDQVRRQWQVTLDEARRTGSEIAPMERPVTCKDGTVRHIELRVAATGKLNVVVFTDITERKEAEAEHEKLQAQLLQAQKMESVGRLAGGVAHDFNNMLSVILGNAELALDGVGSEEELRENLQEIDHAAKRSAEITRQLLAFARRQTINPQVLDLNETVEKMLKMLRRLIGEDIDLLWKPGSGVWPVKIDPSQLDQILVNLCVNARDAIADVGRITIETENIRFDEEYCADHPGFVAGEYVLLAVSDDGCGMDKKTLENIFEPFFTTKDVSKGTGLGLAMIYGIVKQNEGFVNVYSEPGRGTTFRVYFARHFEAPIRVEKHVVDEVPRGSGETVLVVEDEAAILKLTGRILGNEGYKVLLASNPTEAMAEVRELSGKVDLLITDVVMPEMNGRDLAEKLQADYPKLKVLFMSGYTANVIAHHGVLDAGVQFIQKPFAGRDLAAKIREIMG